MNIDKKLIKEALKFYQINDITYAEKCDKCIEFIDKNSKMKKKAYEILNILYGNKNNQISELWKIKNTEELFGKDIHPYITNVLLLCGYKIHLSNMKKYKLDEEQCCIHKKRVRETLTNDIYKRNYQGIRISQMLWGVYFINLRIIEVGRLQYELDNYNPITKNEELCIKIHIPGSESLDIYDVEQSLIDSKSEIKKYFNINDVKYYCVSWILSSQISKLVKTNSNIAKFQNMFDIIEGENCIDDILNFVYNIDNFTNYNELPEDTSLQRNIKEYLLSGQIIKIGIGTLK